MSEIRNSGTSDGPRGAGEQRVIYLLPQDRPGGLGDEIDLSEALSVLWAGRLVIILCTLLVGAIGLTYALLAKPWYRAEVILVPADRDSGQGLASQLSRLGGLAGLAGLSIGSSNKAEPVAVLQSRGFARTFIEEQGLLTILLAEKWDLDLGKWKGNPDIEPDIRDAVEHFTKVVRKVTEDRRTGLVTLRVEWHDPALAATWADLMVRRLNSQMRDRALADAEANVAFLRTELESTQVVSLQQSIGRLLEAELQKLMLARSSEEFSFRIVDPAQVPKKKFKPQRALIVLGSLLVGGLLGVALVLVRRSWA
jgi:uncharacterized protein involved in exopolysaccharide biosynthesis